MTFDDGLSKTIEVPGKVGAGDGETEVGGSLKIEGFVDVDLKVDGGLGGGWGGGETGESGAKTEDRVVVGEGEVVVRSGGGGEEFPSSGDDTGDEETGSVGEDDGVAPEDVAGVPDLEVGGEEVELERPDDVAEGMGGARVVGNRRGGDGDSGVCYLSHLSPFISFG